MLSDYVSVLSDYVSVLSDYLSVLSSCGIGGQINGLLPTSSQCLCKKCIFSKINISVKNESCQLRAFMLTTKMAPISNSFRHMAYQA